MVENERLVIPVNGLYVAAEHVAIRHLRIISGKETAQYSEHSHGACFGKGIQVFSRSAIPLFVMVIREYKTRNWSLLAAHSIP